MRRLWTLSLLAVVAFAAVIITNVSEWGVRATASPLVKAAGSDLGNPAYNVKNVSVYWSFEDGLNVTYVEVVVPRCHRAVFNPVLIISAQALVSVKLSAEDVQGAYASQLTASIALSEATQVVVTSGVVTQPTGSPVTVDGQASFGLEVLVGSGAPLGVEVGRVITWLHFNYSSAKARQKIVWIVKTWPQPPRVVLFYDGFESGSLQDWTRTDYTYAEQKTYDVTVTENCYISGRPPTPQTITDTTRPVAGSWLAWIGFREQVYCEPRPVGSDYLRRTISIPASIDGVEVRYVNVTFWWRFLTWDSANYDYVDLYLSRGASTYYWKQGYNPNPGNAYGPFMDTGWQRNSTVFAGISGSSVTITFFLRTYGDEYYRSWLYVDEVYFVAHFDCVSSSASLGVSTAPLGGVQPSDAAQASSNDGVTERDQCAGCRG